MILRLIELVLESKRERKKAVKALEGAKEFILIKMLEAISNPKKTTTEADIEVRLQGAFVPTTAAIDSSLDTSFCAMEATEAVADPLDLALQADYIPLDAGDIME